MFELVDMNFKISYKYWVFCKMLQKSPKELFIEPSMLKGLKERMSIMREEVGITYSKVKTMKNNQMETPGLKQITFTVKIHRMGIIEDLRQRKKG